jgi:hypothetical protein
MSGAWVDGVEPSRRGRGNDLPQGQEKYCRDRLHRIERLRSDISKTIPFFGIFLGFAYIGHAVWVFEGHASALAAGCKDANVLIVDGEMVPHLQTDWVSVAANVMKGREIYIHDRATYALRKAT